MANELTQIDEILGMQSEPQGGLTLTPIIPDGVAVRKADRFRYGDLDGDFRCEKCQEDRYVEAEENYRGEVFCYVRHCACEREVLDRREAKREQARRQGLADRIESLTPKAYRGITLDPKLQSFLDSFTGEQWLLLRGKAGVGKTTQAWMVARKLAATGKIPDLHLDPHFAGWNVPAYLATIRAGYNKDAEHPDLMEPWLVLLDDVGSERVKRDSDGDSWAREQLFLVINHRWEHQKPTIITTNCSAKELEEHLDERIADRIYDKRLTTVITLTGESWRRSPR